MSQNAANPFEDLQKLSGDMYRHWEKAMTEWWDQVLDSPQFMGAVGKNLEAGVKARSQYQQAVDDSLEKMHLPTRTDVIRVAKLAGQLEDRLLSMEDTLLALQDRLQSMEREALQARIEATEARLELKERLAALQARLAALEAPAAPAAEPAARRKARGAGEEA